MEYVVYLTEYFGNKMPRYYIGSTSKNKIKKGYYGSVKSKKYKKLFFEELKNNPDLFSITILSEYLTRKEALENEYFLQKEKNVIKSNNYINESFANINGYFGRDVNGQLNPMYGTNEIVVKELVNGKNKRIKKEDFDKNKFVGVTKGKVSVININTGLKEFILKENFDKTIYVHKNKGKIVSQETKDKLKLQRKETCTVKNWEGECFRINKNDERILKGEFGNLNSKRWIIIDEYNNEYRTMNIKFFLKALNVNCSTLRKINEKNLILFLNKKNILKNWKFNCIEDEYKL